MSPDKNNTEPETQRKATKFEKTKNSQRIDNWDVKKLKQKKLCQQFLTKPLLRSKNIWLVEAKNFFGCKVEFQNVIEKNVSVRLIVNQMEENLFVKFLGCFFIVSVLRVLSNQN